ncbi:hypothetical protein L9F63_015680 [Diploptera punctata]|uniref:Uncharacterized protein n=1 Tax=Diploptera punctata TaxID=6984 RepID=A0AAD8A5R6_DIPPU|nr:hypothetical protein L9F63_015680 [Diploptera punctata]
MGVPPQETFQTVDLWERQNLTQLLFACSLLEGRLETMANQALGPRKLRKMFVTSQMNRCVQARESSACNMEATRVLTKVASTLATLDTCKCR